MSSPLPWLAKWIHRPIDLDGWYGPQCVDSVRSFLRYVGAGFDITGNAVDVIRRPPPGARWIDNAPTNYPQPGDIVAWNANSAAAGTGPYGHVAVCLVADPQYLITADQNWDGIQTVVIVLHTYAGVAGWLTK